MVKRSEIREGAKWYAKGWGLALLALGTILAFSVLVMFATGTIQKWTADWRGDVKVKEQTKADAAWRIGSYESFYDLCSSVQSDEDSIRNLEEELEADETADDRKAKLRQTITATKNTRAESVRDYNSKAGNELRGAFKDAGLPDRLDVNNFNTECKL
jgi:hypothetical protein